MVDDDDDMLSSSPPAGRTLEGLLGLDLAGSAAFLTPYLTFCKVFLRSIK